MRSYGEGGIASLFCKWSNPTLLGKDIEYLRGIFYLSAWYISDYLKMIYSMWTQLQFLSFQGSTKDTAGLAGRWFQMQNI